MAEPRRRNSPLRRSVLSLLALRGRAEAAAARLPALMLAAEKAAASVRTGEHRLRKTGIGEKFWQFREYMPGDRPQDIDWRQSAKGDRIFVREKEMQTAQTALFWVQGDPGMDYASRHNLPSKKEAAITVALGLSLLLSQAGELSGSLDGRVKPGRSEQTIALLGETFLEGNSSNLPPPSTPRRNAALVLIGDFLAPLDDIAKALEALAAQAGNSVIIQTLDPAEISLPFNGRVVFEGPQTLERHHITNVPAVREAYRQRLIGHIDGLSHLCRRFGWRHILHTTDQDIETALLAAWRALGRETSGRAAPT